MPPVGPGVKRMAARLDELIRNQDPMQNPYLSALTAEHLRQAASRATNPRERMRLMSQVASELLKAGDTEQAIAIARREKPLERPRCRRGP